LLNPIVWSHWLISRRIISSLKLEEEMTGDPSAGSPAKMNYDVIYKYTGQMGRLQWLVFAGVCCLCLLCMESVNMIFVGGQMDHWCRQPDEVEALFHDPEKSVADTDAGAEVGSVVGGLHSRCSRYAVNWSTVDEMQLVAWQNSSAHLFPVGNDTSYDVVPCTSWVYDQSQYSSTIVSRASIRRRDSTGSRAPGPFNYSVVFPLLTLSKSHVRETLAIVIRF